MNKICGGAGNFGDYLAETPQKQEWYDSEGHNISINDSKTIEEIQNSRGGLKPQVVNQPTIGEAVRALFDFMDKEIEVKN